MKKIKIISLALLFFSLNSCRKDYKYVGPIEPLPDILSFEKDVFPLFALHGGCGCHGNTNPKSLNVEATAFTNITTGNSDFGAHLPYIDTVNADLSPFYLCFTPNYPISSTNYMPKNNNTGKLNNTELLKIKKWIEQGAKP